jgi:hypothetical protein
MGLDPRGTLLQHVEMSCEGIGLYEECWKA